MVGFFNKDDEGNYGTAEKDGSANSDNTVKSNEQASGFEQTQDGQASGSMVGIDGLMDKRIKLEESINYVGHMIKTLKDKRSRLDVERTVDIKNLREQLIKIRE